ncbi:MAG: thioredoxin domain-containing protein [Oscillospiraceae bacterium]
MKKLKKENHLINETSPYLLQHAYNPVNWYSWSDMAFEKAISEDKPIFLSIGYSTCHWCHVMEKESFEDDDVAKLLNENFVAIKVDKEERPDIDSIYMNVCTALTGSGGWPLTILMTPDQKPFFAGTYFPKKSTRGVTGLMDLISTVASKWKTNKADLIKTGNGIIGFLKDNQISKSGDLSDDVIENSIEVFTQSFDADYGGFGSAPKFPTPHNLLFLLSSYEFTGNQKALQMVEKTLLQMYKGGLFDHIGFGFSRYSTDKFWLAPHFEKMLYDNALLTVAYLEAYRITKKELYKSVAVKIMTYVSQELTSPDGGFFCAQDADSEGVEGKYYVFSPDEIIAVLGQVDGEYFNQYFDITAKGNFEGKNIPNLIHRNQFEERIEALLSKVYAYRKTRMSLHKDDKILTSWNGLMICAFARAYKILGAEIYLDIAKKASNFIEKNLSDKDQLFVSFRNEKKSGTGFLDDYAFIIWSLIELYNATFDNNYLEKATALTNKVIDDFWDTQNSGFYLYGKNSEQLILKPKELYDGAIPSGNSVMTYCLIKLSKITKNAELETFAQKQIDFIKNNIATYPTGYSFSLLALLSHQFPQREIVCVLKNRQDLAMLKQEFSLVITILDEPTKEYPLKDNRTTFYVCENHSCKPPTNEL